MIGLDPDRVAGLIEEVAAEEILPRFNRLAASDIREKKPGDLVTVADTAAEARLEAALRALLPGSLVVGEEGVAREPDRLRLLERDDPVWVIDPVDGTANFAAGFPLFAVMVSLVQAGRTLAGWIHDPVKGVTAIAEAGGGARQNGQPLAVAPAVEPARMSGAISVRFGNRIMARKIAGRSHQVGSVFSFRCAGQEYLALAQARAHFALYQRLYPWDHAAGVLLHREAGGYARRLDQSAYSALTHDGGLLLAPDEASWLTLRTILLG